MDIFPDCYKSSPLFFSAQEIHLLDGTVFEHVMLKNKKVIEDDYYVLKEHVPGFKGISLLKYKKIWAIVQSRSYCL